MRCARRAWKTIRLRVVAVQSGPSRGGGYGADRVNVAAASKLLPDACVSTAAGMGVGCGGSKIGGLARAHRSGKLCRSRIYPRASYCVVIQYYRNYYYYYYSIIIGSATGRRTIAQTFQIWLLNCSRNKFAVCFILCFENDFFVILPVSAYYIVSLGATEYYRQLQHTVVYFVFTIITKLSKIHSRGLYIATYGT